MILTQTGQRARVRAATAGHKVPLPPGQLSVVQSSSVQPCIFPPRLLARLSHSLPAAGRVRRQPPGDERPSGARGRGGPPHRLRAYAGTCRQLLTAALR